MPLQALKHALQQRLGDELIETRSYNAELEALRAEAAYVCAGLAATGSACSPPIPVLRLAPSPGQ